MPTNRSGQLYDARRLSQPPASGSPIFPRCSGSGWSRLMYSLSQSFMTREDSGHIQPHYSEWMGNSVAVAISNAYDADNQTAHDGMTGLPVQVGVDAAANVLKKFYPDHERISRRKHRREKSSSTEPRALKSTPFDRKKVNRAHFMKGAKLWQLQV
jgi:hypothetical protein